MVIINLLPELILFIGALILLMIDVFLGKKIKNPSRAMFLGSIVFAASALFAVINSYGTKLLLFNDMMLINDFTSFAKIIILILLICVIFVSESFSSKEKRISSEFFALTMIATTGAMLLISANDFLPFYLALELQSLSLYILAAIKRSSNKSSESGMKYFLLGSVSSGILLLGISFTYGFTGTTNFSDLFYLISQYNTQSGISLNFPVGLLLGLILIFISILFKVSAAPFHMWSPDVYEGAPTNITAFFASVIKFTMILVVIKVYINIIHSWEDFNQILIVVAILSLLVGCFGALRQQNLKRMLAYSGIGHVGFIIAGLSAINFESLKAVILYASIYASLSIGAFAMLTLLVNKKEKSNEDENNDEMYKLSSLAGISKTNPFIAACLAILMFSMAGIPPMAGFFAKFYILLSIIKKDLYYLAVIAVMTSIVSAFYYLRIIKIMYFDSKDESGVVVDSKLTSTYVLFLAAAFNLLLITFIKPFLLAIASLFG